MRNYHLASLLCLSFVLGCGRSEPPNELAIRPQLASEEEKARLEKAYQASLEQSIKDYTSIRIIAWNVESGGSDPKTIAERLKTMRADVVCVSELEAASTRSGPLYDVLTKEREVKFGSTGRNDRLAIAWNKDRFTLMASDEVKGFGGVNLARPGHRAPLALLLSDMPSGRSFWIVNNHLARGDPEYRTLQAQTLRDWAASQSYPIVFVGDYNMDYDFPTRSGNEAFRTLLADGTIKWIVPDEFIDTNWADRDDDRVDDYPYSMLDFTFVAGGAKEWNVTSEVITWVGDFPDDDTTSDHRPVLTTIRSDL